MCSCNAFGGNAFRHPKRRVLRVCSSVQVAVLRKAVLCLVPHCYGTGDAIKEYFDLS